MMPSLWLSQFNPHPGQARLLASSKPRNVACCGRRWGKTYALIELMLNRRGGALAGKDGYGRVGLPCAWYAPNDAYFTRVFQDIISQYSKVIRKANTAPRPVIEFRNGGRVDFWTLESPMKCGRGNHYARVVIDEAAHARHLQTAWEQSILWTLADLNGDAWFISTPCGINYFHDLFRKPETDPQWASFTAPSMDNPYLPSGWMEEQRETMPELVFAQEVQAQFVTFGAGLIKPEMLLDGEAPAHLPVVLGVDLAISEKEGADWTAIVATARDPETGILYVREVERHRCGFNDVLDRIKAASARWRPVLIAVEQVQYQAAVVQELTRTTSLPVRGVKPDRDKLTRFLPVLTRYEQRQVRHDPSGVPAWFREELLSFPEGQHDDGCLVSGTMILLQDQEKPIEEVGTGDLVVTRKGLRKVLESKMTHPCAKIFRIDAEGGRFIEGTWNHPVMTGRGWKRLAEVKVYDTIIVSESIKPTGNDKCRRQIMSSITTGLGFTKRKGADFIVQGLRKGKEGLVTFMSKYGKITGTTSQITIGSFMSMGTRKITALKILPSKRLQGTFLQGSAYIAGLENALSIPAFGSTVIQNQKTWPIENILAQGLETEKKDTTCFIDKYGKMFMGKYLKVLMSTTKTETRQTTLLKILSFFHLKNIKKNISQSHQKEEGAKINLSFLEELGKKRRHGIHRMMALNGIENTEKERGKKEQKQRLFALYVESRTNHSSQPEQDSAQVHVLKKSLEQTESSETQEKRADNAVKNSSERREVNIAHCRVRRVVETKKTAKVFNLSVDVDHEYFANGILVHNCDALSMAWAAGLMSGLSEMTPVVRGSGRARDDDDDFASDWALRGL